MLAPAANDRQIASEKSEASGGLLPDGLRPPSVSPPEAHSHPDCRWSLILIVARHSIYPLRFLLRHALFGSPLRLFDLTLESSRVLCAVPRRSTEFAATTLWIRIGGGLGCVWCK
jgi:hypothetical protein